MKKTLFLFLLLTCSILQNYAQVNPANNILGIDITMPQNAGYTYDSAFTKCVSTGMQQIGLFFTWTTLETSPGNFNLSYPDIANYYYPAHSTPVDLTLAPIATNHLEVPSDLTGLAFDDPQMIARFNTLLDSVFAHIPNLQLSSLVIGSEMDVYLGANATAWSQYTNFFAAVSAHAKSLRPGLKVACEATFDGLTGAASNYIQTMNGYTDIIGVSYYPLNPNFTAKPVNAVAADMASVVTMYAFKPIYYYQFGYPSASACNSSPAQQAQFIAQAFATWDTYASNIKMIDFTWMHDLSPATVSYYQTYYGINDTVFLNFLGSLGMRTYPGNGTNKTAWEELICQAKQRGFNNLPCVAGIAEETENTTDVFPNPVSTVLHCPRGENNQPYFIAVYDSKGRLVYDKELSSFNNYSLDTKELSPGLYLYICKNGNGKGKFIKE